MNRHINFHGNVKRFTHNLTYRNFFSGEFGELRPVWAEDAVPGDTFQYHPEARIYFAPLLFPVLTNLKARIDVFFVPDRLTWSEFENFITGGPDNDLSPAAPSIRNLYNSLGSGRQSQMSTAWRAAINDPQSLLSNLGHPCDQDPGNPVRIEDDPFDAKLLYSYHLIYDEYYRDEEKIGSTTAPNGVRLDVYDLFQSNTQGVSDLFTMRRKAWAKDYFTTASLEQQRGGDIPLLTNPIWKFEDGASFNASDWSAIGADADDNSLGNQLAHKAGSTTAEEVESVLSINGLRYLYAASAWLNNNVIGGTRYIEQLRRRYRVVSSDARLQRPEMVGSIELPVQINVISQTSSTVEDTETYLPLGDRAGQGSIIGSGKTLTYSAEEFGWFIGIFHVAPKAAYFQGMRRNLQKEDKFDYFQPEFQGVPQREIRNNEIYYSRGTSSPETGGVFGYTDIYNELRFHNDEVHGDFQDSLLAWTMARKFSSLPSLAERTFLEVDNDPEGNNRIFAAPETQESHIFGVINNICISKREVYRNGPHF